MSKEARTDLLISLAMVAGSIMSFLRGKTLFGIAGAALAVWFIVMFVIDINKK